MDASTTESPRRIHCLRPLLDVPETERPRSDAAAITETVVRLLRTSTGRGPTNATTAISPDLALVTLAGCLTRAEQTLAERGCRDAAMRLRATLHDGIRAEAVETVERVTGRRVAAYLSAQECEPDVAILAFYFGR